MRHPCMPRGSCSLFWVCGQPAYERAKGSRPLQRHCRLNGVEYRVPVPTHTDNDMRWGMVIPFMRRIIAYKAKICLTWHNVLDDFHLLRSYIDDASPSLYVALSTIETHEPQLLYVR